MTPDLQTLAPLVYERSKASAPGRPPKLDWLPIGKLVVNTRYQRPILRGGILNIQRIMDAFSWSRFSPVIVREIPGRGLYEIIDGQHRTTAALSCGYEVVPAMIVQATDDEAARIFASVNGNVTPMQPLGVYKAALAGKEPWALDVKAAADSAGCEVLVYPIPRAKQKPLQTMAVSAVRNVCRQHGPAVLAAAFKLLAASKGSNEPGFLSSSLIFGWGRVLGSRPGWVAEIDRVTAILRTMMVNLALENVETAEAKIAKRMGDGRTGGAAEDVRAKVEALLERKLNTQMIAASLRLPYAEVRRIVEDIRG